MNFDLNDSLLKKVQIRLSERQIIQLDKYVNQSGCVSRSEAVRRLLDDSLKKLKIK